MATINGVTFNLKNLRIVSGHRNILTEQPGSDSNFINDMGYDGLTLRLEGYETSLSDYDSIVSEFMKQGGQILVHRTGWQFTVYSAQLMPGLLEGFDDTYFPYDLILYTSTPYRESAGQQARVKAITSNNEEWTAEDTGYSILHNWNFEDWNDGTSSAPDYYTLYGTSATVNRESTIIKKGTYSAQVNRSGTDCTLYQDVLYPKRYRSKTITLGVWVYASVANRGSIAIEDDDGYEASDYHSGVTGWEFLTATKTLANDITFVRLHVNRVYNGDTSVYCDSAILIEGSDDPDTTFTRDILTAGSVDALPDIEVTGGHEYDFTDTTAVEYSAPSVEQNGLTFDGTYIWSSDVGTDKIYKHNADMSVNTAYDSPDTFPTGLAFDGTYIWSCDPGTQKIYKHNADMSVNASYDSPSTAPTGLTFDGTYIWSCDSGTQKIYKHNADLSVNTSYDAPSTDINGLTFDGTYIWSCDDYGIPGHIYKHNADLSVNATYDSPSSGPRGLAFDGTNIWSGDTTTDKIYLHVNRTKNKDVDVYNTVDSSVVCNIANYILWGAKHRINSDGTGSVLFDEGFYTDKYLSTCHALSGASLDSTNNELDIADGGYIYWYIDTKYPITGIPTLNAQINNTAATLPTIQISTDASTWYDIDTVVVDDVLTEYPLDDDGNLSLKGRTAFYFRIDCAADAVTQGCSVVSFALEVNIVTIDAEHPTITTGSTASTFTCDQDSTSCMNCEIALIYRDRSWAV